jgi:hypothetical protein
MRLMSNFYWKNGSGDIKQIPVMYGDMTRQVASIIKENSENKLISVPRMSVYITGLDIDRTRTSDSSFVSKVNIREQAFDVDGNEYLNTQGKNYTVERLMPTPYTLALNVDIWSSNTDQKLQILEQILMLFNPSLEIQTSDNYLDWTSLSVVNLERVEFSNRTVPVGTESEIDVATLNFNTPIYISPPAKVKRLGVVTNIITSILTESNGNLELDLGGIATPSLQEKSSFADGNGNNAPTVDKGQFPNVGDGQVDVSTSRSFNEAQDGVVRISTTYQDYGVYVVNNTAMLVNGSAIGNVSWRSLMEVHPGTYQAGISQIRLKTVENGLYVIGSITINSTDETKLDITWDTDTIPSNTALTGFDGNERTTIDFIIDPLRWNPQDRLVPGLRLLLLDNIGDVENTSGATAWKNVNNTDFVADEGDIVEWSGSEWSIIFDASNATDPIYTRNLNTGIQYKWTTEGWIKSFEGEYSGGTWMLYLDS